jgi:hypothetical protein
MGALVRCVFVVHTLLLPLSVSSGGGLLPATALPAQDYVLEKLARHRIVLLGEGHWIRHDAELVAALVPRLAERGSVLAMETRSSSPRTGRRPPRSRPTTRSPTSRGSRASASPSCGGPRKRNAPSRSRAAATRGCSAGATAAG